MTMDTNAGASGASTIRKPAQKEGFFALLGGFFVWVFSGFGLFHLLFRFDPATHRQEEIVVYSVHRSFFLWALILTGFVCGSIAGRHPDAAKAMGWIYIWVLLYTIVALLFDISTLKLLLWAGIFSFIWILSKYLEELRQVLILGRLLNYLSGLNPRLDRGTAIVISWLLVPAWIGSLFNTFTNGRKRFTPNEISEFHFGEGSELTDRSGLRFRTRYRDLFESFLGLGAGDLVAYDNQQRVIKRWENVLFLCFIWKKLDAVLHQRAATVDNTKDEPVEVVEVPPVK